MRSMVEGAIGLMMPLHPASLPLHRSSSGPPPRAGEDLPMPPVAKLHFASRGWNCGCGRVFRRW